MQSQQVIEMPSWIKRIFGNNSGKPVSNSSRTSTSPRKDGERTPDPGPTYWLKSRPSPEQEDAADLEEERTATVLAIGPEIGTDAGVTQWRRASMRVPAPVTLYYSAHDRRFHEVELTAIIRDISSRLLSCTLYDVSDEGMGFICEQRLEPGTQLTICAYHDADTTPLVASGVAVISARKLADDHPRPPGSRAQTLWVHGCSIGERDARLLYKSVLDSFRRDAIQGPAEGSGTDPGNAED